MKDALPTSLSGYGLAAVHPTNRAPRVVEYAYDHRGRMVWKTIGGTNGPPDKALAYVWDDYNIVRETRNGEYTHNVWGLDLDGRMQGCGGVGGLLAVVKDGEVYTPTYDANGNISEYVCTNGTIVAHREYDPFGNAVVSSGDAVAFTHWFSTKPWCGVTGVYEYQFRKYMPRNGRWMNRDPLEELGNCNLYRFCENNLCIIDSFGLWSGLDDAVFIGVGALVGVLSQGASDLFRGELSNWEAYVGSAVSGAILGEAALYTGGAAFVAMGAVSGFVGEVTTQALEKLIEPDHPDFDWCDVTISTTIGAGFAYLSFPTKFLGADIRPSRVLKYRGSYISIFKSMVTKFRNGTIHSVSVKTSFKMVTGQFTETMMFLGPVASMLNSWVQDQFAGNAEANCFDVGETNTIVLAPPQFVLELLYFHYETRIEDANGHSITIQMTLESQEVENEPLLIYR